MLFKPKKTLPTLLLYSGGDMIYNGFLKDLPLKESVILAKSVYFFDDPEPCHIHRSAVRVRLTAELQKEFPCMDQLCPPGTLLLEYADFPSIDQCLLTEKEVKGKAKK